MNQKYEINISCTNCRNCESHCSQRLPIPDYIELYREISGDSSPTEELRSRYRSLSVGRGRLTDCMFCHSCENNCPEHFEIAEILFCASKVLE